MTAVVPSVLAGGGASGGGFAPVSSGGGKVIAGTLTFVLVSGSGTSASPNGAD